LYKGHAQFFEIRNHGASGMLIVKQERFLAARLQLGTQKRF